MSRKLSSLVAIGLLVGSTVVLATPVKLEITQLQIATKDPSTPQSAADGSFSQLSPDFTAYSINSDFKFFGGPEAFIGTTAGLLYSMLGTAGGGFLASDYAGFMPGSIALITGLGAFTDGVGLAAAAGAVGAAITYPGPIDPGAFVFYTGHPASIPAVIITTELQGKLQTELESAVPEPGTLALLGLSLAVLAASRRRKI
jgi:hypothetical protein